MDIIELAREIGRKIQQDERYLSLKIAQQNSDEDAALQELIEEFNLKRLSINNEASKPDRDDDKIQRLNAELRAMYADIMKNENMIAYNEAEKEMETLIKRVNAIITQSAAGEDPETTDYQESCGGSCSSCSGCH